MKFVRFRSGLSENFLNTVKLFRWSVPPFLRFLKSVSFPDFWSGVFCSFLFLFLCYLYNIRLIRICQYNFSIFFTLSLSYQPSFKVMADNSANIDHLWKMSFYIFFITSYFIIGFFFRISDNAVQKPSVHRRLLHQQRGITCSPQGLFHPGRIIQI